MSTLEIRNNSQLNGLNVPDASRMSVRSTEDVLDLMKVGQKNRAVGATALNERSSRSHRYNFFCFFFESNFFPLLQSSIWIIVQTVVSL